MAQTLARCAPSDYHPRMPAPPSKPWLPPLALAFGLVTIGTSAILIRLAGTSGVVAVLYRMAIGVLAILPLFVQQRLGRTRLTWAALWPALLAGAFFAGDLLAWSTGVVMSGATNPTLLANTAPLWVGLGAILLFHERLGRRFWFGLVLTMVGAAAVLGLDAVESFRLGLGTLLGLLAGMFYGTYFLVTQRGRQRLDVISYFWVSSFSAMIILGAAALATGQQVVGFSGVTYVYLLALGLGPQALGWLAVNYAQGHLPASIVSPTMLGQPVVTAILAGPILGEWISPWEAASGLVVLLGIWLVHRSRSSAAGAGVAGGQA
jgi:drug/metabolite transporter (DMT)-like permease